MARIQNGVGQERVDGTDFRKILKFREMRLYDIQVATGGRTRLGIGGGGVAEFGDSLAHKGEQRPEIKPTGGEVTVGECAEMVGEVAG